MIGCCNHLVRIWGALAAFILIHTTSRAADLTFEVSTSRELAPTYAAGRIYIIISRTNTPEPRLSIGRIGGKVVQTIARDCTNISAGPFVSASDLDAFTLPPANATPLPSGNFFVQAVFDSNPDFRFPNAPGNLYSDTLPLPPPEGSSHHSLVRLPLTRRVPDAQPPPESSLVKFLRIKSGLLSAFHHRPIYLHAGIVLPRDYEKKGHKPFPLWIRVAGLNGRYSLVEKLMANKSDFRAMWLSHGTPQFVLLQLDGAGPFGDPYYVNSANSGPYADALIKELIPAVEKRFRVIPKASARVLSGTSTGGWVALALQILHPDAFNGAWASCPDPVDFRALELINIYQDANAYTNLYGNERPSERDTFGDVKLTVRREVASERLLGRANNFVTSGDQWGEWTAAFSPRDEDGLPVPLWNAETGQIDHSVADAWKKFDLRLVLEKDAPVLAPKLRGKLHIASGDIDRFFLNDAVHLLDDSLKKIKPAYDIDIVYGPRGDHGWSNLTARQMLDQMAKRVK